MKPTEKKLIRFTLKLLGLVSIAFLVMVLAPQQAHHLLLLIAALLVVKGLGSLLQYREQANWTEFEGKVISVSEREEEVAISKVSRLKYFYPEIEYEYVADGVTRRGKRVAFEKESLWVPEFDDWGDPLAEEKKWWLPLQPGDEVPVYVNPHNRDESVLIKDVSKARRSHHLALVAGGVLLALAWLILAGIT